MRSRLFKINPPKISIITVTFNSVDDAVSTSMSVLNQEYQNYEYIVKDGDSTDGTVEQLRKLGLKVIIQSDTGIFDAINQALLYCKK